MSTNSQNSKGFFSGLFNTAKNVTQKATNAAKNVTRNATNALSGNNSKLNKPVNPVTSGVNISMNSTPAPLPNNTAVKGGAASVGYNIPFNQRQPTEEVMEWATTAGIPTPSGPQMRNVSHGGKRRTHSKRRIHRRKSTHKRGGRKHKKYRSMKRKTHRSRHRK